MKEVKIKPLLITLLTIIIQSICYGAAKLLQGNPTLIGNMIDTKIPFIIYFIIPYTLWYFLIFIIPYIFYIKNKQTFIKYTLSFLIMSLISNIIFIVFPTTIARPVIENKGFFNIITNIVYGIDNPATNCFPSLHCATSFIWILYSITMKELKKYQKILIIIMSLLIIVGTLFIKQHVFIDAIGGIVLSIIVFLIINKAKFVLKIKNI